MPISAVDYLEILALSVAASGPPHEPIPRWGITSSRANLSACLGGIGSISPTRDDGAQFSLIPIATFTAMVTPAPLARPPGKRLIILRKCGDRRLLL